MILGPHRQPLVLGIEAWPFRHRPAQQNTIPLQAKVVMKPGCIVLLDQVRERFPPAFHLPRRWLRRPLEITLPFVFFKGSFFRHFRPRCDIAIPRPIIANSAQATSDDCRAHRNYNKVWIESFCCPPPTCPASAADW